MSVPNETKEGRSLEAFRPKPSQGLWLLCRYQLGD